MAVSQGPDAEVTAETKVDEIDGGDKTCFTSVEWGTATRNYVQRWVADSGYS